jgi:hypothetical protein
MVGIEVGRPTGLGSSIGAAAAGPKQALEQALGKPSQTL